MSKRIKIGRHDYRLKAGVNLHDIVEQCELRSDTKPSLSGFEVFLNKLGQSIKAKRLSKNMTLDDFVAPLDIGVSSLSQIENGRMSPSLSVLYSISRIHKLKIFKIDT